MKQQAVPNSTLSVSRLGFGCANLARWDRAGPDAADRTRAVALVEAAVEAGITLFDHADLYGYGHSEQLFGEVLRQNPALRERIVVQTKCGQLLGPDWRPGQPIAVDLSERHIVASAEASLVRLGVDTIDLLLLHAPSPLADMDAIAAAFDALHASGKVRHFGVSNFGVGQLELLARTARQPIVVNQIHLGLAYPHAIIDGFDFTAELGNAISRNRAYGATSSTGILDWCRLHQVQVQAWWSLRGMLGPAGEAGALTPVVETLGTIAGRHGVTPAAVALAWLLRHPAGIVPIVGTTSAEHLRANCAADSVALDDAEWFALFAAAARLDARALP